jgi:hypothetical protein
VGAHLHVLDSADPMRDGRARRVPRAGRLDIGEEKVVFWVETLPKLRFLWSFHFFLSLRNLTSEYDVRSTVWV